MLFESLSDKKLKSAYKKATELKLDRDFIILLEEELENRGLLKKG